MDLLENEITENNLEGVKTLLEEIVLPSVTDYADYNILKTTLRKRKKEIAKLLIAKGFRVNKTTSRSNECTPLHLAVSLGCPTIIQALLDKGASINAKNKNNETPLVVALKMAQDSTIDLMLPFVNHNQSSNEGITHMHIACMRNRADIVKKFLQHGVPIDHAVNSHSLSFPGYTPLHFAVDYQCLKTVELLIDCGADVTVKDARGLTPVHLTDRFRNGSLVDLILPFHAFNGSNPVNPEGLSHFHIACTRNKPKIVEGFLQRGVDVNMQIPMDSFNWPGFTPLHFAIEYECRDVAELLLGYDADIKMPNKRNMSPLQYASETKSLEILNLIRSKQKIKNSDRLCGKKLPDLHVACTQDILSAAVSVVAVIEEMKQRGESIDARIDLDSPSWPGCTALHLAVEHKNTEVVRMLLKHGAKITIKDARGMTPLHLAFRSNQRDILDVLASKHLRVQDNPVDKTGLSHLHILCAGIGSSKQPPEDGSTAAGFLTNRLLARRHNPDSIPLPNLAYSMYQSAIPEFGSLEEHEPIESLIEKRFESLDRSADYVAFGKRKRKLEYSHISEVAYNFLKNNPNSININDHVDFESAFWPGYTALHFAVKFKDVGAVRTLLESDHCKTDITAKNGLGLVPLDLAIECMSPTPSPDDPYVSIIETILLASKGKKKSNDFNDRGFSLLHLACAMELKCPYDYDQLVASCPDIDRRIDSDSRCWAGCTALHLAVLFLRKDLTELLLRHGADVTLKDTEGNTPLHLMFMSMRNENWGNKVKPPDRSQRVRTPESVAWFNLLLEAGADVNAQNTAGETPVHLALRGDFDERLASVILRSGADINVAHSEGLTPILELIVYHGFRNKQQWTLDVMRHIKMLQAMGRPVSLKNQRCYMQLLDQSARLAYDEKAFEAKCLQELELLRSTRINYRLSLLDTLDVADVDELAGLVTNAKFQEAVGSPDFEKKFPVYGFMLRLQYEKGSARRELFEKAQEAFATMTGLVLPDGCYETMFRYLDGKELRGFIKASEEKIVEPDWKVLSGFVEASEG